MTTAAERLIKARTDAGYSNARQAAEANGWPYMSYYTHETGRRDISVDAARRYAEAYGVDAAWLLLGEARYAPKPSNATKDTNKQSARTEVHIVGTVAAGVWHEGEAIDGETAVYNGHLPAQTKAYKVQGDSMDEIIPDGSIVFAAPVDMASLAGGSLVIVKRISVDGTYEYTLKELHRTEAGSIVLTPRSRNKEHLPILVDKQSDGATIKLCGKVVAWQTPALT